MKPIDYLYYHFSIQGCKVDNKTGEVFNSSGISLGYVDMKSLKFDNKGYFQYSFAPHKSIEFIEIKMEV